MKKEWLKNEMVDKIFPTHKIKYEKVIFEVLGMFYNLYTTNRNSLINEAYEFVSFCFSFQIINR